MYRIALNTSITYLKKEKRGGVRIPIEKILTNKTEQEDTIRYVDTATQSSEDLLKDLEKASIDN